MPFLADVLEYAKAIGVVWWTLFGVSEGAVALLGLLLRRKIRPSWHIAVLVAFLVIAPFAAWRSLYHAQADVGRLDSARNAISAGLEEAEQLRLEVANPLRTDVAEKIVAWTSCIHDALATYKKSWADAFGPKISADYFDNESAVSFLYQRQERLRQLASRPN